MSKSRELADVVNGQLDSRYYTESEVDATTAAAIPYSGYTQVSKKLDNFVFETSSSFLNKVADKNRYVKFGDKVVDTYSHSSYDATRGGVVAQFQVPEVSEIITDGSNTTSVAVNAGDYVVDGSELVINGTFDVDTSGWSTTAPSTAVYDNGTALFTRASGGSAYMQQHISTTVGVEYAISVNVSNNTVAAYIFAGVDGDVGKNLNYTSSSAFNGRLTLKFTATDAITLLSFGLNNYSLSIETD